MEIRVKKQNETILERTDVTWVADRGGAYEIGYENGKGQVVFKGENIAIEIE